MNFLALNLKVKLCLSLKKSVNYILKKINEFF